MKVQGDALAPTIENGRFLMVAGGATAEPGEDVVVTMTDGRKLVRKLLVKGPAFIMVLPVQGGTPQNFEPDAVVSLDPIMGVLTARSWRQHLQGEQGRRQLPKPTRGGNHRRQDGEQDTGST